MAAIPLDWRVFARMQEKASSTRSILASDAFDEALNIAHQLDFQPNLLTDEDMERRAANAARQGRHRKGLLHDLFLLRSDGGSRLDESGHQERIADGPTSLDDAIIARDQLWRLAHGMPTGDWKLLTDVADGNTYDQLANDHRTTSSALRTRVCRLRELYQASNPCASSRRRSK